MIVEVSRDRRVVVAALTVEFRVAELGRWAVGLMPVNDSMFLLAETRERPFHVGGLLLFRPPEGADLSYLSEIHRGILENDEVSPLFRKRPAWPVNSVGQWVWAQDRDMDMQYHVRRSALPGQARIRELLELTSRWHSALLDRHRPLWESHLVEGLADGRFAVYTKVHHALLDGTSAVRRLCATLADTPEERDCPGPWGISATTSGWDEQAGAGASPAALLRFGRTALSEAAGVAPAALKVAAQAFRERALTLPMTAPRTMFNVSIGGARRFAAESWPLERFEDVAKATGSTINDVVLATCSGALRGYLGERGALPDTSLTAAVPASLRERDSESSGNRESGGNRESSGNRVGTVVCDLGTELSGPLGRLDRVRVSMNDGKRLLRELSPLQTMLFSAIVVAPLGVSQFVPGIADRAAPPFNLIISNVPGPRGRKYWNGSTLDGIYPASIAVDGQALNITVTTSGRSLCVGITGCRRSVPHLQRLLPLLDTALADLERATVAAA